MKARKQPPPMIRSWANIPDSAFRVFYCDGCGGQDVTMWNKDGVVHYEGPGHKCGVFRLAGQHSPMHGTTQHPATRWFIVGALFADLGVLFHRVSETNAVDKRPDVVRLSRAQAWRERQAEVSP